MYDILEGLTPQEIYARRSRVRLTLITNTAKFPKLSFRDWQESERDIWDSLLPETYKEQHNLSLLPYKIFMKSSRETPRVQDESNQQRASKKFKEKYGYFGRKKSENRISVEKNLEKLLKDRNNGMLIRELAIKYKLSTPTVRELLNERRNFQRIAE